MRNVTCRKTHLHHREANRRCPPHRTLWQPRRACANERQHEFPGISRSRRTVLRNVSGALVQPVHHALGVDEHVAQSVKHLTRGVHRHGFVFSLVFKCLPLFEPARRVPSSRARQSARQPAYRFEIWSRAPMNVTPYTEVMTVCATKQQCISNVKNQPSNAARTCFTSLRST